MHQVISDCKCRKLSLFCRYKWTCFRFAHISRELCFDNNYFLLFTCVFFFQRRNECIYEHSCNFVMHFIRIWNILIHLTYFLIHFDNSVLLFYLAPETHQTLGACTCNFYLQCWSLQFMWKTSGCNISQSLLFHAIFFLTN